MPHPSVSSFFRQNDLCQNPKWQSIFHAILNTGVRFTEASKVKWLAGYSNVPHTPKSDEVKQHMYIMHDLFHQLWPVQCTGQYEECDRVAFKKSSMAGEIAVLYLLEFLYAEDLMQVKPEWRDQLESRHSLPLYRFLRNIGIRSHAQIMDVLDNLLYEDAYYDCLSGVDVVGLWVKDYWPMLEKDRGYLDINWEILKASNWQPWQAHFYDQSLNHKDIGIYMINGLLNADKPVELNNGLRIRNMFLRLRSIPDLEGWAG